MKKKWFSTPSSNFGEWHILGCACLEHKCSTLLLCTSTAGLYSSWFIWSNVPNTLISYSDWDNRPGFLSYLGGEAEVLSSPKPPFRPISWSTPHRVLLSNALRHTSCSIIHLLVINSKITNKLQQKTLRESQNAAQRTSHPLSRFLLKDPF